MGKKYTESQAKATRKYLHSKAECKLRISPEDKERYVQAAKDTKKSLNAFIIEAVEEKIANDK